MGGGGSPSRKSGMTQYGKWPKQENCKVIFENLQKSKILSVLYICLYYTIQDNSPST